MGTAKALRALILLLKKPYFTAKEAKEVGVHPAVLIEEINSYVSRYQIALTSHAP